MKVLLEYNNEAVQLTAMNMIEMSPNESIVLALKVVSLLDENDFIRDRETELLTSLAQGEMNSNVEQKL